ncbi:anthrax toxin lethal factor-related metalloendopeptidase [Paenibacillus popilliae]|nr:ADP-ribosyltransferase [Paenibacillus popilliae]
MKKKKKLVVLIFSFVIGTSILGLNEITYAADTTSPNFMTHYSPADKAKAEAYSQERYEIWTKSFTNSQKDMINSYKKDANETNKLLVEFRGHIQALQFLAQQPGADPKLVKQVNEIEEMNKLIKVEENKTPQTQTIYTSFSATDIGFASNPDIEDGFLNLDEKKINTIIECLKMGSFSDFRAGNLVTSEPYSTVNAFFTQKRILIELEVPAGTYLAHLGNGQTIFPLDYGMKLTDQAGTVIGKQVLKLKALVVPKDDILIEGDAQSLILNKSISNILRSKGFDEKDIESLKAQCRFMFSGPNVSLAIENSQSAMLDLVTNEYIPNNLLRDMLLKLRLCAGITFQSVPIGRNIEIDGITNFPENGDNPYMRIIPTHQDLLSQLDEHQSTLRTLHHEFGHVIDREILNGISSTPEFKALFEKEKNNITEINTYANYAKTNPQEFFAEVFKSMVSMGNEKYPSSYYRDSIEKEAPETVRFIKDKLKEKGYVL